MGANPDYCQQIRARGVCAICRQPVPDNFDQLAHSACWRRKGGGESEASIRESAARAAGLIVTETGAQAQERIARAERLLEVRR